MSATQNTNNSRPSWRKIYFSILQFGFSGVQEAAPAIRSILSTRSPLKRVLKIVGRIFVLPFRGIFYRFKFRKHLNYNRLQNKPWLLVTSSNNRDVLKILKERLSESVYLTYEAAVSESADIVPLMHFRIWSRLYRFPFIYYQFKKNTVRKRGGTPIIFLRQSDSTKPVDILSKNTALRISFLRTTIRFFRVLCCWLPNL